MIRFNQDICGNLDAALSREWLETNGLGGFASSTIIGLNSRRYHALLVAATKPPVGRIVTLSKLEEALIIDGRRYELSANQYRGAIQPQGYKYQTGFRLDPFPVFTYEVEGVLLEKSIFMPHGENTTVIQYEFKAQSSTSKADVDEHAFIPHAAALILALRPLVAFRDYHSLTHENGAINSRLEVEAGRITIQPYADLPALNFAHNAGELDTASFWYRNFEYREERERGFDFTEDLFSPFALNFDLSGRTRLSIIASTEQQQPDASRADDYRQAEIERRQEIIKLAPNTDDEFTSALVAAADQFIVARSEKKTVIAGYHWFSDWGRDTMIALPGLTLTTGRPEIARSILSEFARYVDRGMLPNRFPDAGEQPEYNTVDATLWFFEAVRAYLEQTGDEEFVRQEIYNVLVDIIYWHVKGTRYNIHADQQGLLYSGEEGVQLTWMDAKVGDLVVTPRRGLAVEIQALWYNALSVMEALAERFHDRERQYLYALRAERARQSFNQIFWNDEAGCLYDVIDGDRRDASLRPNQIFAVSLKHSMLSEEKSRRVVEAVERDLLTPYGLRSLAPTDPQYRAHYTGDSLSRDCAYHQGTVWAWLIGPFITAYLKVNNRSEESRKKALQWLQNFREHLSEAGLGQVSEIFDADEPHTPRGCIAQAWSVAEILRAMKDVYNDN
ncbi:MAG TPA: amylo-alpha-1,6-glucosidase [Pyrinomonadaceae bacterium]|nr:amylo-alpha-1,6-glucosidase [Pyrinomonadaceae bacterium]